MKTYYYAIVNKNGNLITINAQLPIFWNKGVAIRARNKNLRSCDVIRISIFELQEIMSHD